ncbi:MAG: CapA family protein [Anaerolineae bacterium]|nr:CapA family protein [Anaerolineae bacterium]
MKRFLAPLLAMIIILSFSFVPAFAQEHTRTVWAAPDLPADIGAAVKRLVEAGRYTFAPDAASADITLTLGGEASETGIEWVYAVVAPFLALPDAVAWEDVRGFWAGDTGPLTAVLAPESTLTLVLEVSVYDTLIALWGPPGGGSRIEVVPDGGALAAAWERPRHSWSIVPFDRLGPQWKVLVVDGFDLLDPRADLSAYPLAAHVAVEGDAPGFLDDLALAGGWTHNTNRDPARMTTLTMTGVTALTRGTAAAMEREGVLFPARDIAALLQGADLLHVNNEVAFADDCPDPEYFTGSLTFCSKPEYFELLAYVGADIIELTGNHMNDWGPEPFFKSLAMYEAAGMLTFGGGRDPEAAAQPLVVTHNGNTIGFLGCNPVGTEKAWADGTKGGALRCDYDAFAAAITRLSRAVDVVVVTQEYWEIPSSYPSAQQVIDFGRLARAGADIVSGSQAHVAQGFSFEYGGFIHYGLGNLFFDQMQSLDVRRLFIDTHVIYAGRHVSTRLFTGMLEDAARPRPMTEAERTNFLWQIFNASGW